MKTFPPTNFFKYLIKVARFFSQLINLIKMIGKVLVQQIEQPINQTKKG